MSNFQIEFLKNRVDFKTGYYTNIEQREIWEIFRNVFNVVSLDTPFSVKVPSIAGQRTRYAGRVVDAFLEIEKKYQETKSKKVKEDRLSIVEKFAKENIKFFNSTGSGRPPRYKRVFSVFYEIAKQINTHGKLTFCRDEILKELCVLLKSDNYENFVILNALDIAFSRKFLNKEIFNISVPKNEYIFLQKTGTYSTELIAINLFYSFYSNLYDSYKIKWFMDFEKIEKNKEDFFSYFSDFDEALNIESFIKTFWETHRQIILEGFEAINKNVS